MSHYNLTYALELVLQGWVMESVDEVRKPKS